MTKQTQKNVLTWLVVAVWLTFAATISYLLINY